MNGRRYTIVCFLFGLVLFSIHTYAQYPVYFEERFDQLSFSSRWKYERATPSRIKFDAREARAGKGCVKVTLHPGDDVGRGNRAEMKFSNYDAPESEVWYGWSFMIPEDFMDTTGLGAQILAQFHMLPDFEKGETWDTYDAEPMIVLTYKYDGSSRLGKLAYGLKGLNKRGVGTFDITKGQWYDVVWHIKWSRTEAGFFEAWINGEPVWSGDSYRTYGPNLYNAVSPYLKLGLYRNKAINSVNSIYIDEFRTGLSFEEVSVATNDSAAYTPVLKVYPNPSVGQPIRIQFNLEIEQQINLRLWNNLGQDLIDRNYELAAGPQLLWLDPRGTEPGLYRLELQMKHHVLREKVLIIH